MRLQLQWLPWWLQCLLRRWILRDRFWDCDMGLDGRLRRPRRDGDELCMPLEVHQRIHRTGCSVPGEETKP